MEFSVGTALENNLQRKLNLPGRSSCVDNSTGASTHGAGAFENRRRRKTEIRMIQNVKELRPKLSLEIFPNPEGFLRGQIDVGKSRPKGGISAEIGVRPREWQGKSGGVVVPIRPSQY